MGFLEHAPAAAERAAALGAHREAADHYERALRFADDASAELRAQLLEQRAHQCYLAGHFDAAAGSQRQAVEEYTAAGDPLRQGDSLRRLSRFLWFARQPGQAQESGHHAVAILERARSGRELAWAYANLELLYGLEDAEATKTWGMRAIELAERLDEHEVLGNALTNVGVSEFVAGEPEGRDKLERSFAIARQFGLEEGMARALSLLAFAAVRVGPRDLAADCLQRRLDYCASRDLDNWRVFLLGQRARLELDVGDWDRAMDSAEEAGPDLIPASVFALAVKGVVLARRGGPQAWQVLDEALVLGPPTDIQRGSTVAAARAEAAWLDGRFDAVISETDAAVALARSNGATWALGDLLCWRRRAGVTGGRTRRHS